MRKLSFIFFVIITTTCILSCGPERKVLTQAELDSIAEYKADSVHNAKIEAAKRDSLDAVKKAEQKALIAKLNKHFVYKEDEFEGKSWVRHNSAPRYNNINGVSLYFQQNASGNVSNLRFRVQYYADDWLFIRKMIFNIDGENVSFFPEQMERDNDSMIWEWCDEPYANNRELVNLIASAKSVKIKFIGDTYSDVRTMSSAHLKAFKETLEFYRALGGDY